MPPDQQWFSRPGTWFWLVIVIGAVTDLYLIFLPEGTSDVELWEENACRVHELELINYYHAEPTANHPPPIFEVEAALFAAATNTGISFVFFCARRSRSSMPAQRFYF
jgi:hypothetical protein